MCTSIMCTSTFHHLPNMEVCRRCRGHMRKRGRMQLSKGMRGCWSERVQQQRRVKDGS